MKRRETERAGGCEYTLEEIAEILGITRERVRQIEAQALKKLYTVPPHPLRSYES